jgi:acyl carrier protein
MERIISDYISAELVSDPAVLPLHTSTSLMDSCIIDSVAFLNLVMFLEEQFGITVADKDLTRQNFETIDAICAYVRSRKPEAGKVAS